MRCLVWAALATFLLDQATKYGVVHMLDLRRLGVMEVWPPYLNLRMAWNYGINFGLMAGNGTAIRWLLVAVALVISGAVTWWVAHAPGSRWRQMSAGLLVGGALGNVVDRLLYGAVADFLNMSCCGIDNPYAFNVADIAIFVGAVGLVLFGDSPRACDENAP